MNTTHVAIIGGGLSGLYAAYLLEQRGVKEYVIFEARKVTGGRILSPLVDKDFDLGPTWFWPSFQPQLAKLIQDLGLESFEQFETGDMLVERSPDMPARRMPGYINSPGSMRLKGGMKTLIDALRQQIDPTRIMTGHKVGHVQIHDQGVQLDCENVHEQILSWRAQHILLALPPRLATHNIQFKPALPDALFQQWKDTPTWMAPHAKYIAIYDTPFWREVGLSGEALSDHGPLAEIHDASMPGGSAALFGFFGVPAHVRKSVSEDLLRSHCRTQFARLFGPQAASPRMEYIKDWSLDPYTATIADMDSLDAQPKAPLSMPKSGAWCGRITGIASEWSSQFPGYLAGAIDAANSGVQGVLSDEKSLVD